VNPHHELLNAWTNLYEIWYAYHGTWAHLSGLLLKFFPSFCVSLSLLDNGSVNCIHASIARQRLGKHAPASTNTRSDRRIVGRVIFYALLVLSKVLVLPRNSCSQSRTSPAQILCAYSRWASTPLITSNLKSAPAEDNWLRFSLMTGACVPFMGRRNNHVCASTFRRTKQN
jgi:hypothetical protein